MNGDTQLLVLGTLQVRQDSRWIGPSALGGRKPKQLLELLTAARGRLVPKERLIEQLWPQRTPRHPIAALENHVWALRHHLRENAPEAPPLVMTEAEAYRLDTERIALDLDRFDRLVRDAGSRDLVVRLRFLEAALELVRGEVFEDEPYAEWATTVREAYRSDVQRVRLDAAEASLLTYDVRSAVRHASRAMAYDPLSERACRLRMRSLAAAGEREEAVRVFQGFRLTLRTELDLDPLPETLAAYEDLRAGRAKHRNASLAPAVRERP